MIEKLNHYSITTPASIHDEEALTTLELVGRTGAKMNEVIDEVNKFESDVTKTVTEHQEVIDGVPEMVSGEVLKLKEVGTFDEAINKRLKQSMYGTVSVGAKITLTQDGTATAGGLLVKFPNKISLWKPEGESGATKEWSDITTGLSDVYINGDKCNIEVNYGCGLYYDVTTDKLLISPPSYAHINMICLIINRYGRAVGGCLFDEYISYVEDTTININAQVTNNYATYKSTEYAFVYAGNDNDVVIEEGASGTLKITLPANLTLLSAPSNNGTPIVTANCIDNISSYATLNEDGTITVNLPYRAVLGYNLSSGKFGIAPLSYCAPGIIVLVNNIYSNAVSGCLIDEINAKDKKLNTLVSNFETDPKIAEFAEIVANSSPNSEQFMFFTDCHTVFNGDWERRTSAHIDYIKRIYASAPVNFIVDGGDWLTDSHTVQEACHAHGFIRNQFDNVPYYRAVGNHDTNDQGVQKLTHQQLHNLIQKGEKTYYSFETENTKFIVLNSQSDNSSNCDNDFVIEMLRFVHQELLTNTKPHIIFIIHIYVLNTATTSTYWHGFNRVDYLVNQFNNRKSGSIGAIADLGVIDFTNVTGKIHAVFTGHCHADFTRVDSNKLNIIGTKNNDYTAPAIDLVNVDYDANTITIKRVGNGEDRTMTMEVV